MDHPDEKDPRHRAICTCPYPIIDAMDDAYDRECPVHSVPKPDGLVPLRLPDTFGPED